MYPISPFIVWSSSFKWLCFTSTHPHNLSLPRFQSSAYTAFCNTTTEGFSVLPLQKGKFIPSLCSLMFTDVWSHWRVCFYCLSSLTTCSHTHIQHTHTHTQSISLFHTHYTPHLLLLPLLTVLLENPHQKWWSKSLWCCCCRSSGALPLSSIAWLPVLWSYPGKYVPEKPKKMDWSRTGTPEVWYRLLVNSSAQSSCDSSEEQQG